MRITNYIFTLILSLLQLYKKYKYLNIIIHSYHIIYHEYFNNIYQRYYYNIWALKQPLVNAKRLHTHMHEVCIPVKCHTGYLALLHMGTARVKYEEEAETRIIVKE